MVYQLFWDGRGDFGWAWCWMPGEEGEAWCCMPRVIMGFRFAYGGSLAREKGGSVWPPLGYTPRVGVSIWFIVCSGGEGRLHQGCV